MAELTYTNMGDYLIPDLIPDGADEMEEAMPGKYGMLRERFLKEQHHGTYTAMLLSGRLVGHLHQIDQQAQELADWTVAELMAQNGVDEELKAGDQMAWLMAVNSFTAQAQETVLREIVYR